jgi:hypothetical protein
MPLLSRIERYLRTTGTAASRFGKDVAGDPRLVSDMRRGRRPHSPLRHRIEAQIAGATK